MQLKNIRLIEVNKTFVHGNRNTCVLKDINLTFCPGEFVGIAGRNASGKTTLARLLNGLLLPSKGRVVVHGMDTSQIAFTTRIRRRVAMVFQNPENQIVSPVVDEEVAFGPEMLGVPEEEIKNRVTQALGLMDLTTLRHKAPHLLSGGQKQRVAVAAALAMEPDCLVLDEPTSMLDRQSRKKLITHLHLLNRTKGTTIILISHNMADLAGADRIILLDQGRVTADAPPPDVFDRADKLGLCPPDINQMAKRMIRRGIPLPPDITMQARMLEQLCLLYKSTI